MLQRMLAECLRLSTGYLLPGTHQKVGGLLASAPQVPEQEANTVLLATLQEL